MTTNSTLRIKPAALRWFNDILSSISDGSLYSERVTITPDKAAVILSRNIHNRNLRDAKLKQYSRDMKDGNFQFNGESIIVAKDGFLNDGQHRLYACVQSGVPFETLLVVGVERETRFTIDTGSAKSAGDHLNFQGISNANTAAAIARYILSFRESGSYSRRGMISAQQQIELVKSDPLLQEISSWIDSKSRRMKDMMKGSLAGFIYYLLAEKAPHEAKLFMEQFCIGANLDSQSPIFLLRERLRQTTKLNDTQKIEAVIRAWNHWCDDPTTTMSRIQLMDRVPEIKIPKRFLASVKLKSVATTN